MKLQPKEERLGLPIWRQEGMGGGNTTESYKTTDPVAEVHSELFFFFFYQIPPYGIWSAADKSSTVCSV